MQYCLSGIRGTCTKTCKSIEDWLNAPSQAIDKCCKGVCLIFGKCGEGISKCAASICKRPFSFCSVISFGIAIFPLIYGAIALYETEAVRCEKPIMTSMIVLSKK